MTDDPDVGIVRRIWGQQGTHGPKLDEYEVHKIHFTSMMNMEVFNQIVYLTALLENGAGKKLSDIEH